VLAAGGLPGQAHLDSCILSLKFSYQLFFSSVTGHDFSRATNDAKYSGLQHLWGYLLTVALFNE
jgi:hypothetical protein